MARNEGFKYWSDQEFVQGFDANAYLMSQSVMRFDNSTDRSVSLARSLVEGMVSYDKSTTSLQLYDGTAWQTIGVVGVFDHGTLVGLGDDDHPQYHNDTRGDARYYTQTQIDALLAGLSTDHGDLTGLADDDHTQYHNDTRGDARYYTQTQVDTSLSGKSDTSHGHNYLPLTGGTLTGNLTAPIYYSSSNGVGTNYRLGDDCWIGDVNVANTTRLTGVQNSDRAYLQFGNSGQTLGQVGTGALTWTGSLTVNGTIYVGGGTSSIDVLTIRNEIQADNGSSTDPSYTFSSDGDTGMYRVTTNTVGITCGGVVHYFNQNGLYLSNGDWFRTTGQAGWYSETYGGGIYMTDSTWVRTYNSKPFYTPSTLRGDGQIQTARNSTGNIGGASINLGIGNGSGVIFTMNPSGFGPLITVGQGEIFYLRNYLNSSYCWLYGYINNVSSKHYKTNIRTLGEPTPSVGSAGTTFDAMEKVRQLRPVTYHLYERDALPRMPINEDGTPNQRRIDAINRLDKIRKKNGLDHFERDDLKHICGRDCEGDIQNPCFHYKNWAKGKIGFIAQEVGEVLNEVADFSEERPDEHESIDSLGLIAICVKALQEIDNRLAQLESI